jgi:hypothetical protein
MYAKAWKVSEIEALLPDPTGPNAIPPRPDPKVQIEQMRLQSKAQDQQIQFKLGIMKLMKDAELNQAKIHKMEAEAVRALEEAGGVSKGHDIAVLNAEIALAKGKQDGMMQSIELMLKLSEMENTAEDKMEPSEE